jgi:hypothetical protein
VTQHVEFLMHEFLEVVMRLSLARSKVGGVVTKALWCTWEGGCDIG